MQDYIKRDRVNIQTPLKYLEILPSPSPTTQKSAWQKTSLEN